MLRDIRKRMFESEVRMFEKLMSSNTSLLEQLSNIVIQRNIHSHLYTAYTYNCNYYYYFVKQYL